MELCELALAQNPLMGFITLFFISLLLFKTVFEFYLLNRNKNFILKHRGEVPSQFKETISLADHQKAADYSAAKINTSLLFHLIEFCLLLFWTLGGGLYFLDEQTRSLGLSPIWSGLFFFGLFGLISTFLSLPESIYSTFVIEARFGFNKTTPKTFILDLIKGILVGSIFGGLLLGVLLKIMDFLQDAWWPWAWGFLVVFQILILIIYPTWIAPLFNKFTPLEEGETKMALIDLFERVGFSCKELFVMDASKRSSHGNAYFTGLGKKKRIVIFDTLLKSLSTKEVLAVMAHELGHYKMKHILKKISLSFVLSFIGFFILGQIYNSPGFFCAHGTTPSHYMALALFSLILPVYTFLLTPLLSWSSRSHEFEADAFASKHAKSADLISALLRLYKDNASSLTIDPLYSAFYHSHPPAPERISHLEKL